jgi:hypothetical protein
MKNNERTYEINGQTKTFAELTREEKIELLRVAIATPAPRSAGFSNGTPKGGWTDADKVK